MYESFISKLQNQKLFAKITNIIFRALERSGEEGGSATGTKIHSYEEEKIMTMSH